jgi:hypothetical protein
MPLKAQGSRVFDVVGQEGVHLVVQVTRELRLIEWRVVVQESRDLGEVRCCLNSIELVHERGSDELGIR